MKTYHVTVSREVTQTHVLEVEAEDEDEAREQAESEIDNIAEDDWDNGVANGDPEIDKVEEVAADDEEVDGGRHRIPRHRRIATLSRPFPRGARLKTNGERT